MGNLEKEIFRILTLSGSKGLKTERIARHVFNACNSMFTPLDFKEVHYKVSQFLIRNSKNRDSWVEKAGGHGVYRLNSKSEKTRQLMLRFEDAPQKEERGERGGDMSLSLF